MRNENLAAVVFSMPNNKEVAMVAPLLEIPGKIATAWLMPIMTAPIADIFFC